MINIVLNNFIKIDFITKSIDSKSDFVSGHASEPYRITGIHLLVISCKTTSSDASLPISRKIALAER